MTRIIVVRHGESEGNAKNEFHGQYRSDLTEKGHKQAECTAVYLDAFPIDAIYASDIPRAFSTALHTANRRGLTVTPDEGLREIFAGEWEQMKFDDIAERYPEEYKMWHENPAPFRLPGGESLVELCERVKAAFARIAAENDGKTVMVATHATPIRVMRCVWTGEPLSRMLDAPWVPNASVSVIDYNGKDAYNIVKYGEAEHLRKAGLVTELSKKI